MNLRDLFRLETTSDDLLHLDLMRFIASAGIVLCHSGEFFFARADRQFSHERLAGLSLFVDVFFVISGFVIAHIYADRIQSGPQFARFMQRRVGRLYPLHLATLFAMSLLFFLVGKFGLATNTDMALTGKCLAAGALLLHAVVDCGGSVPNGVSWSISAEMVMYLTFPLMLLAARPLGRLRYLLWAGLLAGVASLNPPEAQWASNVQFWRALPAFFFGLCLRLDWSALSSFKVPGWLSVAFASVLIIGSLLGLDHWILLGTAYLAATSAVMADGGTRASTMTRRLAPLGQLTYSMYMLHPIIIVVLVNALGDKLLRLEPLALGVLTLAGYGLIYLASLISFKLFETPARQWIDGLKLVRAAGHSGASPRV